MTAVARELRIRSGNQMIAEGALAAGCRFFAGYPITPASGIYKSMIERLPELGGVAISAPDEISALALCVGASARGARAMTATSGPGWALMVETVQYALMTELPVVIALVQRLGPSTGGATQGAQGDVLLAEYCTSGAYPIPVFAPSTPAECRRLTMAAFHWAEAMRTPVVVLSDKEVGMTSEDVDYAALADFPVEARRPYAPGAPGDHATYAFGKPEEVPPFSPVGGAWKVTMTGSAHDRQGALRKNSPESLEVLRHLHDKVAARADEMALVEADEEEAPEVLLVSFGVTARTCRAAVKAARARGARVTFANVQTLFPVPATRLRALARGAHTVVVAEENLDGQYRGVLARTFGDRMLIGVNAVGRMIPPRAIADAVVAAAERGR